MSHKHSKGQEMQPFGRFGQTLIITHQATETGQPAKRALDDPAARQKHKAVLGLGQLDHHQADALLGGGLFSLLARIPLVYKGDVDRLAGDLLCSLSQRGHLRPVLFIGGGHIQRQQVARSPTITPGQAMRT